MFGQEIGIGVLRPTRTSALNIFRSEGLFQPSVPDRLINLSGKALHADVRSTNSVATINLAQSTVLS